MSRLVEFRPGVFARPGERHRVINRWWQFDGERWWPTHAPLATKPPPWLRTFPAAPDRPRRMHRIGWDWAGQNGGRA